MLHCIKRTDYLQTSKCCQIALFIQPSSVIIYQSSKIVLQEVTHSNDHHVTASGLFNRFVQAVRPPWFIPGHQQDSAEFLQYVAPDKPGLFEHVWFVNIAKSNTCSIPKKN